jgi:N-acetylglucosamine malate deacetylase 2
MDMSGKVIQTLRASPVATVWSEAELKLLSNRGRVSSAANVLTSRMPASHGAVMARIDTGKVSALHSSSLLAVFAHPDDETFRCGGTLALLAQRGIRVHVLTATRGQAGSCGDPLLCSRDELPLVRERELQCACAALGLKSPRLLEYQDGHVAEVDRETIVAQILAVVLEVQPQVMLTFGPDGLSGHPDHIAVGQLAVEAFRRADDVAALYTIAVPQSLATTLGMTQIHVVPDETISLTVDVLRAWEQKMSAIRCHATQLSSSPMMSAPEQRQRVFLGTEYFVRAACRQIDLDFLGEL